VWLSYLEQIVTWDKRDKPLEPRRGYYASLSVQEGGGPLQGNFDYLRVLPDLRGYFSFGENQGLTLAARLRVGELWPTSGNPDSSAVVTRFYGGGSNGMRGFSERRLSPLLEAPAPNSTSLITVPIGGNGWFDASVEARYSLTSTVRLATFVDWGQVTTDLFGLGDLPGVMWAVGLGLRYLTPIGPLRVDVARRLPLGTLPPLYTTGDITQPQPYAVDTSCFGLFGSQPATVVTDGSCVLQISIGEAF
jgi:translocation and assembly module TamA